MPREPTDSSSRLWNGNNRWRPLAADATFFIRRDRTDLFQSDACVPMFVVATIRLEIFASGDQQQQVAALLPYPVAPIDHAVSGPGLAVRYHSQPADSSALVDQAPVFVCDSCQLDAEPSRSLRATTGRPAARARRARLLGARRTSLPIPPATPSPGCWYPPAPTSRTHIRGLNNGSIPRRPWQRPRRSRLQR